MSDLNKVIVIGRLTKDPEKSYTPNGTSITKFSIATNSGYGDKQKTAFVDITTWGKSADFVSNYFSKGKEILIEGRLEFDQWESKEGERKSKLYVTGEKVSFVGSKSEQESNNSDDEPEGTEVPVEEIDDDDIPF